MTNQGPRFHGIERILGESSDLECTIGQSRSWDERYSLAEARAQPLTFVGFRVYEQHGAVRPPAIVTVNNIGENDESISGLPSAAFSAYSGLPIQCNHYLNGVMCVSSDRALASPQ